MPKNNQLPDFLTDEQMRQLESQGLVEETPAIQEPSRLTKESFDTGNTQQLLGSETLGKIASGIGKFGGFLGSEKLGRGVGYRLSSILPTALGGTKEYLQEAEQKGAPQEDLQLLKTGGVSGREMAGSALQTAATIFPFTGPGGKALQAGGRLFNQMKRGALLGGALTAGQSIQDETKDIDSVKQDVLIGMLVGGSLPVAGKLISKGLRWVKGAPERLYSTIFKQAEDDLAAFYKTGGLQKLQSNNPDVFKRFLDKGIINVGKSGQIEINPTLAREALERGISGSSKEMAQYTYLKELELEYKVRSLVSSEQAISLPNKKGYIEALKTFKKEFAKDFGAFPDRVKNASDLLTRLSKSKGQTVDTETALWLRRYIDGMRRTSSFVTPSNQLSARQDALKQLADSLRRQLAEQIPGMKHYMNDYRVYIQAFDKIVEDAVKRQNRNVIGLVDLLAGGGGMVSGSPLGGITAAAAIRGFQQPASLTGLGQAVYKGTQLAEKLPNLGNVPGGSGLLFGTTAGRQLLTEQ